MKIKNIISWNILICSISLFLVVSTTRADTLNIAVASNFASTMHLLADDFKTRTGHDLRISSASTGKLYTQIIHGAPFDVFLAADEKRPDLLISNGKAKAEYAHTYALGKLVLLSNIQPEGECQNVLSDKKLKRLAIANPKTAPYGAAARQVLEKMKLWDNIKPRLVMGENIAQTLQFVSTGSASAGFVAKSLLIKNTGINSACEWDITDNLYQPIKQKMVILTSASEKVVAKTFWDYMQSDNATAIITNNGYDVL